MSKCGYVLYFLQSTFKMKNLITLLLCTITFLGIKSQELVPIYKADSCKKLKLTYHPVLGKGYVLHTKCKTSQKHNSFFHINSRSDSVGLLLNESINLVRKKMKIRTIGPKYFTVKVFGESWVYRYTFDTKSWTDEKIIRPPSIR